MFGSALTDPRKLLAFRIERDLPESHVKLLFQSIFEEDVVSSMQTSCSISVPDDIVAACDAISREKLVTGECQMMKAVSYIAGFYLFH